MLSTALGLLGLAALGIARPAPAASPNQCYPQMSQTTYFTLHARRIGPQTSPRDVQHWGAARYHAGAATDWAALVPDAITGGHVLFQNGTAWETDHGEAVIVSQAWIDARFPYYLRAVDQGDFSELWFYVNAQIGLHLEPASHPIAELTAKFTYYACPSEGHGRPYRLYVQHAGKSIPNDCQLVQLLVQCEDMPSKGLNHPFANRVNCYPSVKDLDWDCNDQCHNEDACDGDDGYGYDDDTCHDEASCEGDEDDDVCHEDGEGCDGGYGYEDDEDDDDSYGYGGEDGYGYDDDDEYCNDDECRLPGSRDGGV